MSGEGPKQAKRKLKVIRPEPETPEATEESTEKRFPVVFVAILALIVVGGGFSLMLLANGGSGQPGDAGDASNGSAQVADGSPSTPDPDAMGGGPTPSAPTVSDADRYAFVSRETAETALAKAESGVSGARRRSRDQPQLVRGLVALEKDLLAAQKAFEAKNYGESLKLTDGLAENLAAFSEEAEAVTKAGAARETFLARMEDFSRYADEFPEAFTAAANFGKVGQESYTKGQFRGALRAFENGIAEIEKLDSAVKARIAELELAGAEALAAGDGAAATEAFSTLQNLQPESEAAKIGLQRAQTIGEVTRLLAQGAEKEADGNLDAALADYNAAFKLDPQSAEAQRAKYRVEARVRDLAFTVEMEAGQVAENASDWDTAEARYREASKIDPRKQAAKDAIARVVKKREQDAVARGLRVARRFIEAQEWDKARETYEQVLVLEPENAEAKEGIFRVGQLARATVKYNFLMSEAQRQADAGDFQDAITSFNGAMQVKPSNIALTADQQQLRDFLRSQKDPVPVTFESDNRTYVSITGFKLIGRFREETVPILPGNYTVVGRRTGYREVERTIRVRNGVDMPPVIIEANEKL